MTVAAMASKILIVTVQKEKNTSFMCQPKMVSYTNLVKNAFLDLKKAHMNTVEWQVGNKCLEVT